MVDEENHGGTPQYTSDHLKSFMEKHTVTQAEYDEMTGSQKKAAHDAAYGRVSKGQGKVAVTGMEP